MTGYSTSGFVPDLQKSNQCLGHRGPDSSGSKVYSEIGIGLGHTRLSIIDPSPAGDQPLTSASGRLTICYNGELYNYQELRAELEDKEVSFRGHSDTEILVELLDQEGFSCLPRLNGIFAFALVDHAAGTVTLFRDRFGVKPLYFSKFDKFIGFASEIKALLAMGADIGQPDLVALGRYLTFLWCPGNDTATTGVKKLGPGEAITLQHGCVVRHWHWHTNGSKNITKSKKSSAALSDQLHVTLQNAVKQQVVADVPVGCFLSGGLDSSYIAALAKDFVDDLQCFTIDANYENTDGMEDDLPYAKKVANHLGLDLNVVSISPESAIDSIKSMAYKLDEPLADPAAINVLFISQLARQNGIKVLLSGTGGDDLFTGYRRHSVASYRHFWSWIPQPIRQKLAGASTALDKRKPFMRRISKVLENLHLDGDEAIVSYFRWSNRQDIIGLLQPDHQRALQDHDFNCPMLEYLSEMSPTADDVDKILALERRFFLSDHNLIYTDKMSMAAGVEVRVPFLDNELVDFAATIPAKYLQRGMENKWILKKAAETLLPNDVIYRPKTGFGAPLRQWIRGDLREFVRDNLSEDKINRRGIFDPKSVQSIIDRNQSGEIDASYTIFSLLNIELWFQHFLDRTQLYSQEQAS